MRKYKYFLMLFSGLSLLLLMFYFPISFDNNDDQAMFFINSGVLSGAPSAIIIHTNLIIGELLKKLFFFSLQVNWYTIYLQAAQYISLLTIYYILIYNEKIDLLLSGLLLCFLLSGFSVLCIVKLQYTIVALLCCAAALLCIQSELPAKRKYVLAFFLIILLTLIRKDSFYIFIAFNIPILVFKLIQKNLTASYVFLLVLSIGIFFTLRFINDNNASYRKAETYTYFKALDDVIDKPVKYSEKDLHAFGFTTDDMVLLKARYPGSNSYSSGKNIIDLSKKIKANRTSGELITELKKFISDEQYIILIYALSITAVVFFTKRFRYLPLFNLLICLTILLYLAASMRIPHRVTFPILIYASVANVYLFITETDRYKTKVLLLTVFALLGCYKFYRTCQLINMHNDYHKKFTAYQRDIDTHPDYLFISLYDGLPVQFMNAWQTPANCFPHNNLIMTGWNVWAPDFQITLQRQGLKNLSSDLKNKSNILFLTNMETFQQAFIHVMWQRYNLKCHFKEVKEDFKVIHPKKLVFDN